MARKNSYGRERTQLPGSMHMPCEPEGLGLAVCPPPVHLVMEQLAAPCSRPTGLAHSVKAGSIRAQTPREVVRGVVIIPLLPRPRLGMRA